MTDENDDDKPASADQDDGKPTPRQQRDAFENDVMNPHNRLKSTGQTFYLGEDEE
jgi:hypothetical protein